MAISDALPGVKIEVIVNGAALKEHEDHELVEDRRTTTRYIEAVSGQVFAVAIKLLPSFEFKGDCVAFPIFADGTWVQAPHLYKGKSKTTYLSEGRDVGGGMVRECRFAALETGK